MYKKNSYAYLMLIFFALFFITENSFSQNCKAELKVEKDRNFKSASSNGATFNLVLTNNSSQRDSFVISQNYLSTPCHNNINKSSKSNIELKASVVKTNAKLIAKEEVISLMPGQTFKFQVKVDAPEKNTYGQWSCIEIKASSQNCRNVETTTTLSVFSANPSDN